MAKQIKQGDAFTLIAILVLYVASIISFITK